jgi:ferredoxin
MSCRAVIDEAACAAHGDCALVAPNVFAVEDVAVVIGDGPRGLLVEAARACPSCAIDVVDDATGEIVYP